jgi:hypothetical protein
MYNVGLLFSCLARDRPFPVLDCFSVMFAVVVQRQRLPARTAAAESQEKIDARIASLREEKQTEWDENAPRRSAGDTIQSDSRDSFGRSYHRLLNRSYLEYLQDSNCRRFPVTIKYADRFWEAERSRLTSLYEQRQLADRFSSISPMSLYDDTMSALAGTDLATFQSFMDAIRAYRAQIIEYVRSKTDGFSSPSFFTPCTNEEVEEYETLMSQLHQIKNPAEMAALYQDAKTRWEKVFADTPSLDLRDFPVFTMPHSRKRGRAIPTWPCWPSSAWCFRLILRASMKYDTTTSAPSQRGDRT